MEDVFDFGKRKSKLRENFIKATVIREEDSIKENLFRAQEKLNAELKKEEKERKRKGFGKFF